MKTWTAIFVGLMIGSLSGVGLSQMMFIGDVRENKTEIKAVKERVAEINGLYEARMNNIIKLWEAQLNTERELIALVREQIRVIERRDNERTQ